MGAGDTEPGWLLETWKAPGLVHQLPEKVKTKPRPQVGTPGQPSPQEWGCQARTQALAMG